MHCANSLRGLLGRGGWQRARSRHRCRILPISESDAARPGRLRLRLDLQGSQPLQPSAERRRFPVRSQASSRRVGRRSPRARSIHQERIWGRRLIFRGREARSLRSTDPRPDPLHAGRARSLQPSTDARQDCARDPPPRNPSTPSLPRAPGSSRAHRSHSSRRSCRAPQSPHELGSAKRRLSRRTGRLQGRGEHAWGTYRQLLQMDESKRSKDACLQVVSQWAVLGSNQ